MSEHAYLALLDRVLERGDYYEGRNGGVRGLFGEHLSFDLTKGFPLLTTKRVYWKAIVVELLWFLRGDTNIKFLRDHGVTIWDSWADANGDLGPVYGRQWRDFAGVDQIADVIESIKRDPHSRRHIVSAWNPAEVDNMALPPCHALFQFHVDNERRLSCHLYQRSADIFLGVPFNIASYALLTHMIARETGLGVGTLHISFGDVHLYENHVNQAREQLSRRRFVSAFPALDIDNPNGESWLSLPPENYKLIGYAPLPTISAPVSK